jgi:biotin-(acetyl-CoA carboxylase) ligase
MAPGRSSRSSPATPSLQRCASRPESQRAEPSERRLIEGRKVAGILPEASVGRVVLGIGVNVNQTTEELPAETPKPATALRVETGREWRRAPLLAAILVELERRYDDWQRLHTNR